MCDRLLHVCENVFIIERFNGLFCEYRQPIALASAEKLQRTLGVSLEKQ